jgi:glycosyltransferase involved in cell wall biosynthesis
MRLGIDASNLRVGGGITHIVELLRASDPGRHGFVRVNVWGGAEVLDQIENRHWLTRIEQPSLNKGLAHRISWQYSTLFKLLQAAGCDLLFAPGGSHSGKFHPVVTMCRNMLPFEWRELRRYGVSAIACRLILLRWMQTRSFRQADGTIFLTEYARSKVIQALGSIQGETAIVPHGVSQRFAGQSRTQLPTAHYSPSKPFRLLYVSAIDMYKHQWHLAKAVARLRREGFPLLLDLVGPAYAPAMARLRSTLDQIDQGGESVRYLGAIPLNQIHACYREADAFIFASSCENMPNILLEAMASGLPIACSNRGPMPEVLGNAGLYFNPQDPEEIARVLRELISSPAVRTKLGEAAQARARPYSWDRCAQETYGFLARVLETSARKRALPT